MDWLSCPGRTTVARDSCRVMIKPLAKPLRRLLPQAPSRRLSETTRWSPARSWQCLLPFQTDSLCFLPTSTNQCERVSDSSSQSDSPSNMRLSCAIATHQMRSCSQCVIFRTSNGSAPIRRQRVSELKFPEAYELQILLIPFEPQRSICCCLTASK